MDADQGLICMYALCLSFAVCVCICILSAVMTYTISLMWSILFTQTAGGMRHAQIITNLYLWQPILKTIKRRGRAVGAPSADTALPSDAPTTLQVVDEDTVNDHLSVADPTNLKLFLSFLFVVAFILLGALYFWSYEPCKSGGNEGSRGISMLM
jgi:hypothetical protein